MKITTGPDGSLLLEEGLPVLRWSLLAGAAGLSAHWGDALSTGTAETAKLLLEGAAVGFLLLCGLLVQDSRFQFDTARKILSWESRRLIGTKQGQIPFSDIRKVAVLKLSQRDGTAVSIYYQVILVTDALQLRLGSRDLDETEALRLAEPVHKVLGIIEPPSIAIPAEMAEAGTKIDAIKARRMATGETLDEVSKDQ